MRKGVSLWNPWILIPAGVIVLLIGLILFLQTASKKRRYTDETIAEVLSVSRGSHYSNGRTMHVYTPTVAYIVNGNRYEVKGQGSGLKDYYAQGAEITVHYNPNKPEKCMTIPVKELNRSTSITMLIGAGIALLGAVAMLTA